MYNFAFDSKKVPMSNLIIADADSDYLMQGIRIDPLTQKTYVSRLKQDAITTDNGDIPECKRRKNQRFLFCS